MILLVAGLLPYDSGKTSFALELIKALIDHGFRVAPFKPIASHNAWYHYEALINSIDYGALIGRDIYRLARAAGYSDRIEMLSPIDMLIAPLDPVHYFDSMQFLIDSYTTLFRQAVLLRISMPINGELKTRHYLIRENYDGMIESVKQDVNELIGKIGFIHELTFEEFMNMILDPNLYHKADEMLGELKLKFDIVVVESFNDAATPIPSTMKSEYVFIVSPGRVLVYSGDDYAKTVEALESCMGPLSLKTHSIVALRKPLKSLAWKPKRSIFEVSDTSREAVKLILGGS